ncbi:hypothetical protein EW146_g1944 [Bondarzewia mesenterica]|uniref:Uncharacterized protein n=1 Tax=Bondarzewia mesenterica TaxID=1095465 RepID=A0A4S4M8G0_9AGAM|nr:hypothetical protein EW146_g1944 [Bondarzewia mesenterica]
MLNESSSNGSAGASTSLITLVSENVRKRTLSVTTESDENERKRPRQQEFSFTDWRSLLNSQVPIPPSTPRERPERALEIVPGRTLLRRSSRRSISRTSSMVDVSRAGTPFSQSPLSAVSAVAYTTPASSFRSPSVPPTSFPEPSAHKCLKNGKVIIDFSGITDPTLGATWPVSWSHRNILVFGRGNRINLKNLTTNEDVVGLAKVKDHHGSLRLLDCGGEEYPHNVALSTSKGLVQVWDLAAQKMTMSWWTKPVTALKWNGLVLSVGGEKGSIRHFDTRIKETAKMKEQNKKVLRHQSMITALAWNHDGKILGSADNSGVVYCWDSRQNAPLDVGDLIQRRRKMQHVGAVKAVAWCPWSLKMLASGDAAPNGTGTIRLWNINGSTSQNPNPDALELDAQITSLHWSSQCKELLSTHSVSRIVEGPAPVPNSSQQPTMTNCVAVHSYPTLTRVKTEYPAMSAIAGSVLSPNGLKVIFAVPEDKQLKIWDVWGKKKELRRQRSVIEAACAFVCGLVSLQILLKY